MEWRSVGKTLRKCLLDAENEFVPMRSSGVGKYRKAIWMTHKAVQSVRKKHNLFRKYRDCDNRQYKDAVRQAKIDTRNARRNFEKKLAEKIKDDNKSFYAYIRGRNSVRPTIGPLLSSSGEKLSLPEEISEEMNVYFSSVFTKEDLSSVPDIQTNCTVAQNQLRLDNIVIDEKMVMDKLTRLRSDKATGADSISPRLLVEISKEICHPLTIIFNKSLKESRVPSDWKEANVCPIFKKGSRSQPGNYRPVSLTSQICKLCESILRDKMVQYIESNGLIQDSQHGFRRGRSCLTNLLIFLDKVTRDVDEGRDVDAIYLDFAKAFDKVPHQRLLVKLRNLGIDGSLLGWIGDWLDGRRQRVCIGSGRSGWRRVTSSVPQGSVLGPLLFLVFINDLEEGVFNTVLKFADDTKLFGVVQERSQHEQLQSDLSAVVRWSRNWQMDFNVEKCKVLHFGRGIARFDYSMDDKFLKEVSVERDLGVLIADDLKVAGNCRAAYNKANRALGMIKRSIAFKCREILLPLYKSLVRPLVEYCTPAWSPHYQKDKDLIERIQHRFTRLIPGLAKLPYSTRLDRLNLWTLEERRNRADLIELYKISRAQSSIKLTEMFEPARDARTRGHSLKLSKNRCRLDMRKYFFSERVVDRWNELDQDTVSAETMNGFKNGLAAIRKNKMGFFTDT